MVTHIRKHRLLFPLLGILLLVSACSPGARQKTEVLILNAGSLVIPFAQIEKEYERLNPDIDLRFEGHGSIQVIRHTTEIGDPADLAIVADHSLLPILMYPAPLPDGSGTYASWHIQFATNKLGIAFTDDSRYGDQINSGNWYEILSRPDVNLGIADPRLDAVGYRSLMLIQLAELYYKDDAIFERLITPNFAQPIASRNAGPRFEITVPELLEATDRRIYLRGFSVQLLSLLEARQIDYAFEYESVARQHGLRFLELPPEIDMSQEVLSDLYHTVRVTIDFRRFKTVRPVFDGEPIIYGATIPASAPHPEEASRLLSFLIGQEGQRIMNENYHPPLVPPRADNLSAVPAGLRDSLR
jgi:molybdate/tungstate transport system substrate-binding protein